MPVHSLTIKRPSSDGARSRPASAALISGPREPLRRVLIRRSWGRAIEEPAAPDLDNSHTIDVGGGTLPPLLA